MKQISYLLFLLLVSCSLGWKLPEDRDAAKSFFKYWKEEHGKIYKNDAEEEKRIRVFAENMKFINKLNDMYRPETMFYINQYADMSPKEFREKILMPKRQPPAFETVRYIMGNGDDPLPDSFDWTEKNMVTEIKDQGDGGTCWAFSTIGNIEGQWAMKGQQLTNFSVEQIVDCDGMEDVKGNHADCGVFGGWPYLAYQYVMKAGGLETWENYTYCSGLGGAPGTCEVCPAPGYNNSLCGPPIPYCNMSQSCVTKLDPAKFHPGLKVQDWRAIVENETIIAQQLMKVGPLSVALNAELLQFYHRGVFNPITCNPKNLDHAVLLVGFGKEKILFKEEYYWKVKNSWGVKWGEKGYFRIKRGAGTCGINTQVTTAILADV